MITSESPGLARSGQVVSQSTGKDEDSRNGIESSNTTGPDGLGEDPDVRVIFVEGSIKVGDHEHVTDQEGETDQTVHKVCIDHSLGNSLSGILDFLSQVSNTIRTCEVCKRYVMYMARYVLLTNASIDGRDLTDHQ